VVYKLYRFTKVHLQLQADPLPGTTALYKPVYVAMNYIPALETAISSWPSPTNLEVFEGPAVGFYAAFRGSPYNYTVPSKVLNAMPYNWYETKQNTPEVSDFTQGQIFLKTTDANYYAPILATFTLEFQTLEDPEFLASLQSVGQPRIKQPVLLNQTKNRKRPTRSEEEYDKVSIYSGSHTL
jgi:hypothetical protein